MAARAGLRFAESLRETATVLRAAIKAAPTPKIAAAADPYETHKGALLFAARPPENRYFFMAMAFLALLAISSGVMP